MSISVATSTVAADSGFSPMSSRMIGRAKIATMMPTGSRMVKDQVSSAEAMWLTCLGSLRASGAASSGITRAASAPPATSSKMMFGMLFAVW